MFKIFLVESIRGHLKASDNFLAEFNMFNFFLDNRLICIEYKNSKLSCLFSQKRLLMNFQKINAYVWKETTDYARVAHVS